MGVKHELLYYKLTNQTRQFVTSQSRWENRMKNLNKIMKDIDKKVCKMAGKQIDSDFKTEMKMYEKYNIETTAKQLFDTFRSKYYWKDWFVIAYSGKLTGIHDHEVYHCNGNSQFIVRTGSGDGKTVLMVYVDKASGSSLTKNEVKDVLRKRISRYHTSYPYLLTDIKHNIKFCSITKGILVIRRERSAYKYYGDERIVAKFQYQHSLLFAVGSYGIPSDTTDTNTGKCL